MKLLVALATFRNNAPVNQDEVFTSALTEVLKTADVQDGLAYEPHPDEALHELRAAMQSARDDLLAETATEERRYQSAQSAAATANRGEPQNKAPKHGDRQASSIRIFRILALIFIGVYATAMLASGIAAGIVAVGHWWGAAIPLSPIALFIILMLLIKPTEDASNGWIAAFAFIYPLVISIFAAYLLSRHWHANSLVPIIGASALDIAWVGIVVAVSLSPNAPEKVEPAETDNPSPYEHDPIGEVQAALGRWREALERQVLPRFARQWFNERLEIGYGTRLDVRVWSGLWQPGEDFHVETRAVRELAGILARSADGSAESAKLESGGSIGLYGPRGAGKTHLIRSFCDGPKRGDNDLTIVVTAPVGYAPSEFVLHIDARICQEVLRRLGTKASSVRDVPPTRRRLWDALLGRSGPQPLPTTDLTLANLARRVDEHRRQLYYLMTVADEFSGKASFKVVEAGMTSNITLAQQPRTYPEIVEAFRALLLEIVRTLQARIIIGIDDLDRIDSAERARSLLHEIKAIFGVPGCFYLVSISDEAMSDFDQGGQFRGAFDSAFDELVRVDRLDVQASKDILAQRTAVMSEPFRFLCHCLAGGLARELVRIARIVADDDLARPNETDLLTLSAVTERLVTVETQRLCLAVQGRFAPYEHLPSVAAVMRALDAAAREPATPKLMSSLIGALLNAVGEPVELIDVARVTAARLYQLMSVLEIFTDHIEPERLREANRASRGTSLFDELAWARQQALVSPLLAWRALARVRSKFELAVVPGID